MTPWHTGTFSTPAPTLFIYYAFAQFRFWGLYLHPHLLSIFPLVFQSSTQDLLYQNSCCICFFWSRGTSKKDSASFSTSTSSDLEFEFCCFFFSWIWNATLKYLPISSYSSFCWTQNIPLQKLWGFALQASKPHSSTWELASLEFSMTAGERIAVGSGTGGSFNSATFEARGCVAGTGRDCLWPKWSAAPMVGWEEGISYNWLAL